MRRLPRAPSESCGVVGPTCGALFGTWLLAAVALIFGLSGRLRRPYLRCQDLGSSGFEAVLRHGFERSGQSSPCPRSISTISFERVFRIGP